MKIKNIVRLNKKFPQCDLTTETNNFYIKAGDKYILVHNSPALFIWSKYPGYPDNSIALKGFTSGPKTALSSPEEIDAKYGDRPDMANKLKLGLQLARYIPAGECWQGDCLFSKDDIKEEEINGTRYLTFMPNKIVYAFSEENADYNKVKNADFGIAFHTIYRDSNGEMKQGFDTDPTKINAPDNFYIMSPAINASKDKADYDTTTIENEFNNLKSLEQKLVNDPAYEELINNQTFMNYWNTFENANLADKKQVNLNANTFINDLKDYVSDKLEKEYDKKLSTVKTDKGRQNATDKYNRSAEELSSIIDNNKSTLTNLVKCLNTAANIKMLMWDGLRKAKNDYSAFYKSRTKGYIPSEGEGIAMSDMNGNIVKIVDRSTFSSYNRDPDIMSGFEHESLQTETLATQGADMGSFKSFTKKLNLEEDTGKTAVVAFGRFNPPTIGHRKLAKAMANATSGEKAKIYLSHKVNSVTDPLSYESKLRWAQKEFGDLVDVVESNAKTVFEVLSELYDRGYTDIILAGGDDRIGGVDDYYNRVLAYNGKLDKNGNLVYQFNSITPLNAGERNPSSSDYEEQASASLLRKLVIENNFDEFKNYVYLDEKDAMALFRELKYAMKGKEESFLEACNRRIKELNEASPLKKKNYTPYVRKELDRALDKIDTRLDAPDPNKDAAAYRKDLDDYTGLFTKQGSVETVVYSEGDIKKLYPDNYNKILNDLDSLEIEDESGKDFNITKTGTNVITKSGGGLESSDTTLLQEAISGLILGDKIDDSDVKSYLLNSDPENRTGIFKYLNFNKQLTQADWNDFIKKWGNSFNVEQSNKGDFINVANSVLDGNVTNADIIHDAIKNKYSNIARELLTGADKFDKSDVYFCVGDTNKILNKMLEYRKNNDILGYVNFMVNNSDKIIGVSLKQVGKSMRVAWDIPAKKSSDFSNDVYWPATDAKSQALVFKDAEGEETYILAIRSNSNTPGSAGAIEWREEGGAAQMGKGSSKIADNFGDSFAAKLTDLRKKHDFKAACKLLLDEITGVDSKPGNIYKMSKSGKQKLVSFFNDSCGFNSTNKNGERISAPYIKVY